MLKKGDEAPDFNLPGTDDKMHSLKDFRGKNMILYFYPKDDTSGCTAEACEFRDNLVSFNEKDTVIIGISKDSIKSHNKFKDKYGLPFLLLSDTDLKTIKDYDVWKEKSMYGKKYMGIERTTYVIDKNGIISDIYNNVKVQGHINELLNNIN
jgi:peroxiredoxin Q/BCP